MNRTALPPAVRCGFNGVDVNFSVKPIDYFEICGIIKLYDYAP